jgi:hypothetical protein
MPAAHAVRIFDNRGIVLARARTVNISECGVFVLVNLHRPLPPSGQVRLEIVLPAGGDAGRRDRHRTVLYLCRIARVQSVGQMKGLGLAFVKKLR